jgi:hypothetical protein
MGGRLALCLFVLIVALGAAGCSGWATKDTFDCLDQHCYLPDWTNCNSCISECWRKDGYNFHWRCHHSPYRPPVYVNR